MWRFLCHIDENSTLLHYSVQTLMSFLFSWEKSTQEKKIETQTDMQRQTCMKYRCLVEELYFLSLFLSFDKH